MRTSSTLLALVLGSGLTQGQFTLIANDPAGDSPGGLDATALHYWYEETQDLVTFRITCTNLASYSTGPAADFSFGLPNGMDGGFPAGAHWTTPGTPVHKISSVYCDPGGSPPSNYTYTAYANNIVVASTAAVLCASDCAILTVDVLNNHIYATYNRTDIITDTEMGGPVATIVVVSNAGHDLGWDDNISATGTMTIDLTTGIDQDAEPVGVTLQPNPCSDQLQIDLAGLASSADAIEISDLSGRIVRRERLVADLTTLDVSSLASGGYLASISFTDRAPITSKIRIE